MADKPTDPTVDDVIDSVASLEEAVSTREARQHAHRIRRLCERLARLDEAAYAGVEDRISKYTTRDVVEGLVGSVLFTVPMLVEDGYLEIGAYFAATRPLGVPVGFLANVAFLVVLTAGLLYYADFRQVAISRPLFGLVPRRLLGVLVTAFVVAAVLLTLWGRIEWTDPWLAVCQVSVVWVAGAFGAAITDILPGESRGRDVNDVLEDIA